MSLCEDTWPEDEAGLQADYWRGLFEDYPADKADNESRFRKDCARMEGFFAKESDGPALIARFRAEILKQTGITLA